ncbi:MAG: helix-turn-helix domain-containing protein [Alphaproteobacteria bacterium]|nr:helix-turn-helix domain-containing protein [Alphaproteobacteria bacterium]
MREKLSTMRANAGYTQYSIASQLGISRSHYSQIEGGTKSPSLNLSMRIKIILRYTNDDLFAVSRGKPKRGRPIRDCQTATEHRYSQASCSRPL